MVELNGVKVDNIEAENRRLKRENRQLREDNAILEKATVWSIIPTAAVSTLASCIGRSA